MKEILEDLGILVITTIGLTIEKPEAWYAFVAVALISAGFYLHRFWPRRNLLPALLAVVFLLPSNSVEADIFTDMARVERCYQACQDTASVEVAKGKQLPPSFISDCRCRCREANNLNRGVKCK